MVLPIYLFNPRSRLLFCHPRTHLLIGWVGVATSWSACTSCNIASKQRRTRSLGCFFFNQAISDLAILGHIVMFPRQAKKMLLLLILTFSQIAFELRSREILTTIIFLASRRIKTLHFDKKKMKGWSDVRTNNLIWWMTHVGHVAYQLCHDKTNILSSYDLFINTYMCIREPNPHVKLFTLELICTLCQSQAQRLSVLYTHSDTASFIKLSSTSWRVGSRDRGRATPGMALGVSDFLLIGSDRAGTDRRAVFVTR